MCILVGTLDPYLDRQQGDTLCRKFKSVVESFPRATGGFPHGKPESEQRPSSYLSSCCVVVTGEMTRHIEQKELIYIWDLLINQK